jgi:hypothetical protein
VPQYTVACSRTSPISSTDTPLAPDAHGCAMTISESSSAHRPGDLFFRAIVTFGRCKADREVSVLFISPGGAWLIYLSGSIW